MGIWSDWYSKNAGKESYSVNAEFVLKKIDEGGEAALKMTLNDAAESNTLPTTDTNTPAITLLQTIRNNLKWLFNNKANNSHTHDDRYYTESEVDTKLNGKAASSHAHSEYALLTGATFTGTVSAPNFTATSSRTVKKNIKSFKKSALNIIKKVNIVSFKYKKSKDSIPQIGFIAEDTDPLLSGENQDSMRLNSTIGLLLKAIQELIEKEEILEKEVKELKRKK
jgi:hypothetical protein